MRKIKVDFQIKSLDTSSSFTGVGEYKNNRIKFVDYDNNINFIVLHGDVVEFYKKGNVDMKYKFDMNTSTKGEYILSGHKLVFDIVTHKIVSNNHILQIKYDLYQNSEIVNKTEILIKYTFLEEE